MRPRARFELSKMERIDDPKDWKDLQVKVADLFRETDCKVEEEVILQGARDKHKVDVFVICERDGLETKMIIECKFWNSRVDIGQVMALAEIVSDLGAEKGIIVSKKGFQKGAYNAVKIRNIDLLTFRELVVTITDGLTVILDKHCSGCGEWVMDTTATCPHCGNSLWKSEYTPIRK